MNTDLLSFSAIPNLSELMNFCPKARGFFFDMDGTLFNTESVHEKGMLQMAKKYQIKSPLSRSEVHKLMMGKADHLVFDLIKNWPGIPESWDTEDFIEEKNLQVLEILETQDPRSYVDQKIVHLLEEIFKKDYFLALVTSSEKVVTEKLLERTGLHELFKIVMTRNDCPVHKPNPWPYVKAIELSGLKSEECLIFEDSSVGLEAALKSGAKVAKVSWYDQIRA